MTGHMTQGTATEELEQHEAIVADLRRRLQELEPEPERAGDADDEEVGVLYDFHTHTFLSDGVLSPIELIRRAIVNGYTALGIADHVGASTLARVVEELMGDAELARRHWNFPVFVGVELTHVPASSVAELAAEARRLGAAYVVVHGESPVEPVEPGTNRAAVSCPEVDVLAHPGLLTAEEARIAAETGVFIEITAKDGHSLGNGRVAGLARQAGARCLLNSDAHLPSQVLTPAFARTVARGAGVREQELDALLRDNPERLIARIEARR